MTEQPDPPAAVPGDDGGKQVPVFRLFSFFLPETSLLRPNVAHWPSIEVPDRVAKKILDRY